MAYDLNIYNKEILKNLFYILQDHLYRDVMLVVTELGNHVSKPMVKDMIFNIILSHVYQLVKDTKLHDDALPELVLKLLPFPILGEMPKYLLYIYIKY